jgi:hypothetical protein
MGPAAAEQHDTVLYKEMECGMEISAKYLEGNDASHSWLSRTPWSMGCGRGCGSDGDGDTLDSGDVPGIRLGWREDGDWGGQLDRQYEGRRALKFVQFAKRARAQS